MTFDFDVIAEFWPILVRGAGITLYVSSVGTVAGLGLGLIVALGRLSKSRLLRGLTRVYVEVIRGTPLLVQVYVVYFALPDFGVRLSAIGSGVIALSLYMGAYAA